MMSNAVVEGVAVIGVLWLREVTTLLWHYYGEREKRVDSQRFPLCFIEPKFFERE
jgi:hypothetical protein